jgi:hypothetical protein
MRTFPSRQTIPQIACVPELERNAFSCNNTPMALSHKFKHKLNCRTAAGFLALLLLLSGIAPGFGTDVSPRLKSAGLWFSPPANAFDLVVCPSQPKIEYSPYLSKSNSDYTLSKRVSPNDTLTVYHNYESRNGLPRLLGPAPILPSSRNRDKRFFLLFADIPPPFSDF